MLISKHFLLIHQILFQQINGNDDKNLRIYLPEKNAVAGYTTEKRQ